MGTREAVKADVLAMPAGRETDALVALLVLGCRVHGSEIGSDGDVPSIVFQCGCETGGHDDPEPWEMTHLRCFSETADGAAMLMEWLCAERWLFAVRNVLGAGTVRWRVSIATDEVEADSLPLAICRAALLAWLDTDPTPDAPGGA